MKKENLLLTVIAILVFITGLIIGKSLQNDTGRFFYKEENGLLVVFDTKTGEFFIKDKTKYIHLNMMDKKYNQLT